MRAVAINLSSEFVAIRIAASNATYEFGTAILLRMTTLNCYLERK